MLRRLLIVYAAWLIVLWPVGVPTLLFADAWWPWPLAAAALVPPTILAHERQLRREHGVGWRELERRRRAAAAGPSGEEPSSAAAQGRGRSSESRAQDGRKENASAGRPGALS